MTMSDVAFFMFAIGTAAGLLSLVASGILFVWAAYVDRDSWHPDPSPEDTEDD